MEANEARARLLVALVSLPPLVCAECGASVRLERAATVERGGRMVDVCPLCATLAAVQS